MAQIIIIVTLLKGYLVPLIAFAIIFQSISTQAIDFQDDVTLTKQQSAALQKFKTKMLPRVTEDFMKDDLYLLRFLRARNFDLNRAEEFLAADLKWRKDNKMATIHQEDWSDFKDYPYDVSAVDKQGRPVLTMDLGYWDVRKKVVAGQMNRLVRFTMKVWDEARMKVRESELQGKNVTRWTFLLNLKNINADQHINPTGIPYYVTCAAAYDTHFPGMGDNLYLINTPGLFETVLALVRPIFTPHTRDSLKVYGSNRNEWEPLVHAHFNIDQLPPHYGGTKPL